MPSLLRRTTSGALSVALLSVGLAVLGTGAAQASTTFTELADNQSGNGPCTITGGYYATGTGQHSSYDGQAWCADFAGWLWQQAGATVDGNLTDGSGSFYAYDQAHGTLHTSSTYQPQIGDAAVFDYEDEGNGPGNGTGAADHVAIVSDITYNSNGTIASLTHMNGNRGGVVAPQTVTSNYSVGQEPSGEEGKYSDGQNYSMMINAYVSPVGLSTAASFEEAFQADTGRLFTDNNALDGDNTGGGMLPGTSPSISALY